jgi:arylformamidase
MALDQGGLTVSQHAQQKAVAPQGPFVFMEYDQAALDAAYNQAHYAPHSEHVRRRVVLQSEEVRKRLGAPQRVAYGPSEIEQLDIYRAAARSAPIVVFIHGGAWRRGTAKGNAYAAEMFLDAGMHFVVPDFAYVQDAPDSLRTLADQVRRAIAWTWRNAASFGGDPQRLYVAGHSSGGHLAGVAVTTDWPAKFGLPQDIVKAAALCSGMYDLYPVSLSSRREYVPFDDDLVESLSPQRHLDKLHAPLAIVYGTLETPEFQRQSRDFAEAVKKAGKRATLVAALEYNHFELKETLASPYGAFGRAMLALIEEHGHA